MTAHDHAARVEPTTDDRTVDLTAERPAVRTETVESGRVRARKRVTSEDVERRVPRGVEHADLERVAVAEGDSGEVETLPDGSISIPVFEEQLVIEKRLVVRERVVLRKHTVYEDHLVQAELRREELDVGLEGDVAVAEGGSDGGRAAERPTRTG